MSGARVRLGRLEREMFRTPDAAQAHGEAVVGRYLKFAELALSESGLFYAVLAELPCVGVHLHREAMSEQLRWFLGELLASVARHGGEAAACDLLRLAQEVSV